MERLKSINEKNIAILEENGFKYCGTAWDKFPLSAELETYTDGGEDMIISLEAVTREKFEEYIENFDVNENVLMWWKEGLETARKMRVPFNNIKEHYEDYEKFLERLRNIAKLLN
ncbi:MAG: hypothetical protein MR717_09140 [Prevotella sp.]|nr:hypothetical protein [Prevotella sp.]